MKLNKLTASVSFWDLGRRVGMAYLPWGRDFSSTWCRIGKTEAKFGKGNGVLLDRGNETDEVEWDWGRGRGRRRRCAGLFLPW